jgi:hypothetical protein
VIEIAGQALADDDGVEFLTKTATSRVIRDQAIYPGVRVAMDCAIATAMVKFRLDVSFGDPITPGPSRVTIPALRPAMEPVHVLATRSRPSLPNVVLRTLLRDFELSSTYEAPERWHSRGVAFVLSALSHNVLPVHETSVSRPYREA